MIQEAIEASKRALKLAKGNRAYYKEQLAKFRKAAASK
jgi:hypothetical protein